LTEQPADTHVGISRSRFVVSANYRARKKQDKDACCFELCVMGRDKLNKWCTSASALLTPLITSFRLNRRARSSLRLLAIFNSIAIRGRRCVQRLRMLEIRIKLRAASKIRERRIRVRLMAVRDITAKSIDTGNN